MDDHAAPAQPDHAAWWRDAVIYQVYPRSFADGNGDGIGDLPGIRAHLDHLHRLGVDAIWLSPFYPSPQRDAGYDVSDPRGVEPTFGTVGDFDGLLADAHALGIRLVVDIVPNHTSSDHPWFRAALAAGPDSPERARYLFRDGRGPGGDEPPNDWRSRFGGRAWTRVTEADGRPGQWYLHLFDSSQPDLDWTNPEVVQEYQDVLRFWLDRGVDGFRIDVAHGLAKAPGLPDLGGRDDDEHPGPGHPHWDRPAVHDIFRGWRKVVDEYPDRMLVGEIWVATAEQLATYLRPDELHTAFNFNVLTAPWSAADLRARIDASLAALAGVGSPATWVLSNHDVIRPATRYLADGDDPARGTARARAGMLLMLALPGSTYLYQGEELGLPEVLDLPADLRQDPVFHRTGGRHLGRDGCRVPLPWSGDAPPFGFGPGAPPWLPQPAGWATLTVAAQEVDPASTLSMARAAIAERRRNPALGDGTLTWLDAPDGMLALRRDPGFACVVNLTGEPQPVPSGLTGTVIAASDPAATADTVPPDATVWLDTTAP